MASCFLYKTVQNPDHFPSQYRYRFSAESYIERWVRIYRNELNMAVLLRLVRVTNNIQSIFANCYYQNLLASDDPVTETFVLGNTGLVTTGKTVVKNSFPEKKANEISFVNQGPKEVAISHIMINLHSGVTSIGSEELSLMPNETEGDARRFRGVLSLWADTKYPSDRKTKQSPPHPTHARDTMRPPSLPPSNGGPTRVSLQAAEGPKG